MKNHSDSAIDSMEAIFALCEAMDDEISMADLLAVMRDAVKDGHEMMELKLAMVSCAAGFLVKERKAALCE